MTLSLPLSIFYYRKYIELEEEVNNYININTNINNNNTTIVIDIIDLIESTNNFISSIYSILLEDLEKEEYKQLEKEQQFSVNTINIFNYYTILYNIITNNKEQPILNSVKLLLLRVYNNVILNKNNSTYKDFKILFYILYSITTII